MVAVTQGEWVTQNNLAEIPGQRLLALFDALVRRDVDNPGLSGVVALGVDGLWWCADFTESAKTEYQNQKPPADAHVVLSVGEAEDVLLTGKLGHGIRLTGDADLFLKFIKRYTEKRTWLDIRAR